LGNGTGRTILVVDDGLQETRRLSPALRKQRMGLDVVQSTSVDEAWSVLRHRPIDVVLLDVSSCENSGLRLLQLMADQGMLTEVPVVILAGEADEVARRTALDLGAGEIVGKPVDLGDLVARIKSVLKATRHAGKACGGEVEELVAARTAELERSRLALVIRLAKIAEMRDESTGNHVVRVGCYAEEVAAHLGMDCEYRKRILLSSPMHDLGKLFVPEEILRKPSALTRDEWDIMREHCEHGARMLHEEEHILTKVMSRGKHFADREYGPDPILAMAAGIALNHHERWDGQGYPRRVHGENIPLEARIVSLADAFDALTTVRPYRSAVPESVALEVMMADQGTQFDPAVFDAFVECFPRIQAIRRALPDVLEN
jgi:putative two-component system response regulator